ncbi:hypothetical protein PC9H_011310 [Pleurotus ostreatus]|uniref:Uncharacterized protein n=1 Tax=Pleurotus ostreatus TaxID=5322 RepID=A0A8H7DQF2_PLEOS|nr:uncharacterized protein PC9H_011310 [Pleurotus ostreatus]KAF7420792.1 hypothetical protein PC9H_011310 [Pleurotus ostreatus]
MSTEQVIAADAAGIVWKEMKSENGATFEVGVKLSSGAIDEGEPDRPRDGPPIAVDWPVGDDTWKDVDTGAKGITRYKLHSNSPSIWKYRLDFSNVRTGQFVFFDESGDGYKVSTYQIGDHYFSDTAFTLRDVKSVIIFDQGASKSTNQTKINKPNIVYRERRHYVDSRMRVYFQD